MKFHNSPFLLMVPKRGLEPPHLTVLDPKSSVSTNSTTSAHNEVFNLKLETSVFSTFKT